MPHDQEYMVSTSRHQAMFHLIRLQMCGAQEHGSFWPLRCALRCQSSCKSRPTFGRQGSPAAGTARVFAGTQSFDRGRQGVSSRFSVRDHGADTDGSKVRFNSSHVPSYLRKAKSVEKLLEWFCTRLARWLYRLLQRVPALTC